MDHQAEGLEDISYEFLHFKRFFIPRNPPKIGGERAVSERLQEKWSGGGRNGRERGAGGKQSG